VLVLTKRNAVAEHIQPITVSYTFQKTAMLLEPLYLVLAFFVFFIIWCDLRGKWDRDMDG
jgi:oligosaccharyltransferase complex subunit alpha (ribophorin I)